MTSTDKEACPKCGQLHERSEYHSRPSDKAGDGVIVMSPYDIECSCGIQLRWCVPIFKVTASGYMLRPLQNNETLFIQ